ncbi:hypothetical protein [Thermogemmatispora sp.]|uniref:hypothetical protein n=1 Tax=Thermogemmatispora sp. TaxID=1968838 RepID=UPI001D5385CF|nr:hypothetical protein [Thermogemmatispora sp.]MBX5450545.1 hypothetical protein [Thermogemmatispora sp.]
MMQPNAWKGNDWGERTIPAFERYSYRAKVTLASAIYQALGRGRAWLDGSDLLMSLLHQSGEVIETILQRLEVKRADLVKALERQRGMEPDLLSIELVRDGLTPLARQILRAAVAEADLLQQRRIEPEHLFLGALASRLEPLMSVLREPELALSLARVQVWTWLCPPAGAGQGAGQPGEPELVLVDLERQVQLRLEGQRLGGRLAWPSLLAVMLTVLIICLLNLKSLAEPFSFDPGEWISRLQHSAPFDGQPLPGWQPLCSLALLVGAWFPLALLACLQLIAPFYQALIVRGLLGSRREFFWRACRRTILYWTVVYLLGGMLASLLKALLPLWWWLVLWLLFTLSNVGRAAWGQGPFPWSAWPHQELLPAEAAQICTRLLARRGLQARLYLLASSSWLPGAILFARGWSGRLTISLSETLLEAFPPEEVEALVALELAPYSNRGLALRRPLLFSLAWLPLLMTIGLIDGFLAPGPLGADLPVLLAFPHALILLIIILISMILYKMAKMMSNYIDDKRALRLTGDVLALKNALIRAANINGEPAFNQAFSPLLERLRRIDLFFVQQ